MKYMTKLAFFALLAAFALGACDTGLAPVSPDYTEVNKSYNSVSGTNAVTGSNFPTLQPNYQYGDRHIRVVGNETTPANTIVEVTFPSNAHLDAFEGNPDNAVLATRLQSFLSFYNVAKRTAADTTTANAPAKTIPYSVVRRTGNTVYLQLDAAAANKGIVQWKIDGSKYTYRGGNTFDADGNGVAGEPFYDDKYGRFYAKDDSYTYNSDTYAGSIDEFYYQAPLDGVSNAGSIVVYPPSASWTGASATVTFTVAVTANDSAKPEVDYTEDVKSHIRLETYANSAYTPVDLTWSRASSASNQYKAIVTVANNSIYRIRAQNGIESKTKLGGAVQRIWFSGIPSDVPVWDTYQEYLFQNTDTTVFNQKPSGAFWVNSPYVPEDPEDPDDSVDYGNTGIQMLADDNGYNVSLVYTLNQAAIGKLGLPTTIPANSIKVGYFAEGDPNKVVLIPTKNIELRYSGITNTSTIYYTDAGKTVYTRDQLVIELAETVHQNLLYSLNVHRPTNYPGSTNKVFLFISEDYSFLGDPEGDGTIEPGKFGNFANISIDVGGVYKYGVYGLDTDASLPWGTGSSIPSLQ
jgi:hypothetical protein